MLLFYCVQAVFTIWMLVDAIRRRPDYYWYIIVFVPFGPLVYFFAIKIHDYDLRWLERIISPEPPPPSIESLRREMRRTPSLANRLRLAGALHDAGQFLEAAAIFEAALEMCADDPEALRGLGRCRIELGDPEDAIEPLARLVDEHRSFRDYVGCLDLAEAYAKSGHDEDAIRVLSDLVQSTSRLQHRIALAEQLVTTGNIERAQAELRRALEDHEHAPDFAKKRDRGAARQASTLLQRISPRG